MQAAQFIGMLPMAYHTVYLDVYPIVYHIWFTYLLQLIFLEIEANGEGGDSP